VVLRTSATSSLFGRGCYRVVKPHRSPLLCRLFFAEEPEVVHLRGKPLVRSHSIGLGHPVVKSESFRLEMLHLEATASHSSLRAQCSQTSVAIWNECDSVSGTEMSVSNSVSVCLCPCLCLYLCLCLGLCQCVCVWLSVRVCVCVMMLRHFSPHVSLPLPLPLPLPLFLV